MFPLKIMENMANIARFLPFSSTSLSIHVPMVFWHHKKRSNISASLARTPVPPKVNARKSEHAACGVCTRWRWSWRNNVAALGLFANFMATLELNFPASYARGCPIDGTFRMPLKQSVSSSADADSNSVSDSDSTSLWSFVIVDMASL